MKKKLTRAISAILLDIAVVGVLCCALGISVSYGIYCIAATLFIGRFAPEGALRAGVLTEIWTGELVRQLGAKLVGTFLDGIPDYSAKVGEDDVIHLVDVGGNPEVLINNTTYPLVAAALTDGDIPISLDKFETVPSVITDDDLYALSYDKQAADIERHRNAIANAQLKKSIHALCPNSNSAKTPVIFTSGETVGTRKRMIFADIVNLKSAFDALKVPDSGRRLVLSSDHANDLLLSDQKFREQYNINPTEGKITRMYGFDIYTFVENPYFTVAGNKKAFGATVIANEAQASVAYFTDNTFKANGSTKMYYSDATTDPFNHQSVIDFLNRFIVLPKRAEGIGAIASTYVSA